MMNTMATASMTVGPSYSEADDAGRRKEMAKEQALEESIQKLRMNLTRYARANDRRMVLRSLKDVRQLSSLPLDPVPDYDGSLEELEHELQTEYVTINGIAFRPAAQLRTTRNNTALTTLRSLCDKLCEHAGWKQQPEDIYKAIVLRIAKTTASADPYFQLNSFLGSAELLLQPIEASAAQKPSVDIAAKTDSSVDSSSKEIVPIEVNVYASDGNIHVTIAAVYWFGLFRKSDVKPGKPWISIEGHVKERTNLTNESAVRSLCVKLPALY